MNERILVLSDCHLTSGINHETGVWSPTEDFFWDKEFVEFLEHYSNERTTLILNGDFFDFMQVLVFPTAAEMEEYNISENEINHVYGLRCTESSCAFQINKVIDGHIDLFKGLADFIQKGNRIKILKGNHDIQLTWNKVQEQMINRLAGFCSPTKKHLVQSNLEFLPWFYLIPGLLYVEHGNQYEYTTSFRNFLNPYLPFDYEEASKQIELDLSSFLVRYFTNRIEPINPLADNIRPLSKFYQIFWRTNPFVFISTLSYALRYVLKAFKKSRELLRISKNDIYSEIEQKNLDMIKEEALKIYPDDEVKSKELTDHLISFDARKADPVLTSGAWRFVWNMIKIPLKNILWLIPLYLLTFIPNLTDSIIETIKHSESSPWNSILETLLQFKIPQIILIVIVAFILIVLLQKVRRNSTKPKNDEEDIIVKIREDARFIASKLEVKYVTFGHTHYPDIVKLDNNRWYFNSGTWMSLLAEKEQIYRDLQQFSFLKIENEKAELLSWKTGSKTARPVTVVDTNQPHTSKEDSIIKLIFSLFSRR